MLGPSMLIEQRVQPLHEWNDFGARRVAAVVLFRDLLDDFHHVGETSATFTAFAQRMIDFRGHDELPAVLSEERQDGFLDVLLADVVAMADDHRRPPRRTPPAVSNATEGNFSISKSVTPNSNTKNPIGDMVII